MKFTKIIKDALALFVITLVAGAALGYVYEITKEPIKATELAAKQKAYQTVFEGASDFKENEELKKSVDSSAEVLKEGGFKNISISEALDATDANGQVVGLVMTVTTKAGYGGDITITLGIDGNQTVKGVEMLAISETAGLGMKAKDDIFKSQYKDKSVEQFVVTKQGASQDSEIDAISGATITSDAVTGAVNAGIYFANSYLKMGGE